MTTSASSKACARCGVLNLENGRFCASCGFDLYSSAAAPTPNTTLAPAPDRPLVPAATTSPLTPHPPDPQAHTLPATASAARPPFWQQAGFWPDVLSRARQQLLPLALLLVFGSLDFQLHGQAVVTLAMLAAGVGVALFFREATTWATNKLNLGDLSSLVQPLFVSVPAGLWFILRGHGVVIDGQEFQGRQYSDSGVSPFAAIIIGVLIAAVPLIANHLMPRLDSALRGFYEFRDRYVSDTIRPFVMIAASIVLTFGLIHGNLTDVDVLFGGQASKIGLPQFSKALIATVANLVLGFVITRKPEAEDGADEEPA